MRTTFLKLYRAYLQNTQTNLCKMLKMNSLSSLEMFEHSDHGALYCLSNNHIHVNSECLAFRGDDHKYQSA